MTDLISTIASSSDKTAAIVNALKNEVAANKTTIANMGKSFATVLENWQSKLTSMETAEKAEMSKILSELKAGVAYVQNTGLADLSDHVKTPTGEAYSPATAPALVHPVLASEVHVKDDSTVVIAETPPPDAVTVEN